MSPWPEQARRPSLHRSSLRQRSALRYSIRSLQALFYHFFFLKTNQRRARGQWPANKTLTPNTTFRRNSDPRGKTPPGYCRVSLWRPGCKSRCSSKVLRLCPFHRDSRNFSPRRGNGEADLARLSCTRHSKALKLKLKLCGARCRSNIMAWNFQCQPFTTQGPQGLHNSMKACIVVIILSLRTKCRLNVIPLPYSLLH